MADTITKEQYEELQDAEHFDPREYHELLKEYSGIVAEPYTAYSYYDAAGNYLGDSTVHELDDLLKSAYVEVADHEGVH